MKYRSTRNNTIQVSAAEAIVQGISVEGGLFVPESLPKLTPTDIDALRPMSYQERAEVLITAFLSGFSSEEVEACTKAAYTEEKFGSSIITPLCKVEGYGSPMHLLELWHGPTCAFKDVALQILPHLLTTSMRKVCEGEEIMILVATSGDTGKAALEGFKNVAGTKILVFYPDEGVSSTQKLQMQTQEGENVGVCGIKGNFDDAQNGVKKIFTNSALKAQMAEKNIRFSSANSINWGRLLPQIVYYFSSYCDLPPETKEINITVPTGNFGNILAAYYAKKMGLPIKKLICASNCNNILTDFIQTGIYDRNRDFHTTISPSMDILISSNLERLLYDFAGCDDKRIAHMMESLKTTGKFDAGDDIRERLQAEFYGGFCDDISTKQTIGDLYRKTGYLCDTHTAVAVRVYQEYVEKTGDTAPTIITSTASPYKFAESVLGGIDPNLDIHSMSDVEKNVHLSQITATKIPTPIISLSDKDIRFTAVCEIADMSSYVANSMGI